MSSKVPTTPKKPKAPALARKAARKGPAARTDGTPRPVRSPAKATKTPQARRAAARTARPQIAPSARVGRPAKGAVYVPRAMPVVDDDDVLMAQGAGGGAGFGRCGGRMLGSRLEQVICDRLGRAGVAHSHSPRHFEVTLAQGQVAAYAPMVVLRGRGREGKSVVIEAADDSGASILRKVVAFRGQYGPEYYVILVAPDEVLDEVPLATYDEACSETNINTLIARLSE